MESTRSSPLGGRKPTREDLERFAHSNAPALEDVIPPAFTGYNVRLLIVGINPGLWTAAVNAPFARPGNRFWPALHRAGLTQYLIDASTGLSPRDEKHVYERGIAITNLVGRATARADQLTREELQIGGRELIKRLSDIAPDAVAIAGITAFRLAFSQPRATLGKQRTEMIAGWPSSVKLWVVPQPSGLNAHENIDSLAAKWQDVAEVCGLLLTNPELPPVPGADTGK